MVAKTLEFRIVSGPDRLELAQAIFDTSHEKKVLFVLNTEHGGVIVIRAIIHATDNRIEQAAIVNYRVKIVGLIVTSDCRKEIVNRPFTALYSPFIRLGGDGKPPIMTVTLEE